MAQSLDRLTRVAGLAEAIRAPLVGADMATAAEATRHGRVGGLAGPSSRRFVVQSAIAVAGARPAARAARSLVVIGRASVSPARANGNWKPLNDAALSGTL